jgi:two-component sensor histidine kinase
VGVEGSLRNVTGRRTAEDALKKSLKEKEVLLREIHHRVKNNFQIISSLLNLQTRGVQDEGILQQFNEIKSRIRSMSLIHEKLYQSKEISLIDFASYIGTISKELFRNYYTGSAHPEFIIETDPVLLTIDQAIPCGLIINELLTNTFKYAFPPHWEGKPVIRLALRLSDGEKVLLSVSDNGVGIPSHIDHRTTSSLGLSLITMLTAQIGGEIRIDRAAGTSAIITFSAKQQ